jgi:hypothetical protein
MLELTSEQVQALEGQKPLLELVHPRTREVFVLIRQDVYQLACGIVGGGRGKVWDDAADEDLIRKKP